MPNIFAYLMLLIWPLVVFALFRKLPPARALIWSILGGYMALPQLTSFDLPMIPALDKTTIPNLTALAACVIMLRMRIVPLPDSLPGKALILLFVLSPVATVLNNAEPIVFDAEVFGTLTFWGTGGGLPGLRPYDAIAFVGNQLLLMLPLFLARHVLASSEALREIIIALALAGVIYSVPMLIEARVSPQLHTWVYGFFQHNFSQALRQGGYRPFVFMPHGLWVAFFTLMAFVASLALLRQADATRRLRATLLAGYMGIILLVAKTMGVNLMAAALIPLVLFFSARMQIRVAAAIALGTIAYPLLRGAGLVPVWEFRNRIAEYSAERAASFAYRLWNEDRLLAHAAEKPLFGWGSWGRNHLYNPLSGQMETVSDGFWIIVIGTHGWLGYIATFGLLGLPLLLLWWRTRRIAAQEISPWAGPLALILAFNMLDLIPNATLIPFTWLLAGALLGHAERLHAQTAARARLAAIRYHSPARRGLLPGALSYRRAVNPPRAAAPERQLQIRGIVHDRAR